MHLIPIYLHVGTPCKPTNGLTDETNPVQPTMNIICEKKKLNRGFKWSLFSLKCVQHSRNESAFSVSQVTQFLCCSWLNILNEGKRFWWCSQLTVRSTTFFVRSSIHVLYPPRIIYSAFKSMHCTTTWNYYDRPPTRLSWPIENDFILHSSFYNT